MKIWYLKDNHMEHEIEVGDITVLNGQHMRWYGLIRSMEDFFNGRQSQVQLYEDNLPINKKDWQCFIIPFDAALQLNKITAKSPMKEVQSDVSEQIAYSVFFQELQEVWEQFNDELQLINKQLNHWGLNSSIRSFEEKDIREFIQFHSNTEQSLSPLAMKTLLLNIMLQKPMAKKMLIIIELPELYANKEDLDNFLDLVHKAKLKGYKFLIVSSQLSDGVINYQYDHTIINNALLEKIKRKTLKELPFYCSDELYEEAKHHFLHLVDNSISTEYLSALKKNKGAIISIIHVIMYNLNIGTLHDIQGIEPNLKKFIAEYR